MKNLIDYDLNGFSPAEVEVKYEKGVITIRALRYQGGTLSKKSTRKGQVKETRVRSFAIPRTIKEEDLQFSMKNERVIISVPISSIKGRSMNSNVIPIG